MNKKRADKRTNVLLIIIAVSCALRLMWPGLTVSGVSPFSALSCVTAIMLVFHLYVSAGPADRKARK